ncbi:hypothetical protein Tsubulata_031348 [Turnera subulata]|uniref:Uncharacterized protein n=1 Tax=Turnera subulata TaxID=218843 RepID=A0A9Q0FSW0_9ROSI|nr:hypothetical protein Tsubulata_031348 [Turnera subulata]
MNPHPTTTFMFEMFQFQLKSSSYVPHGSYNRNSQTHHHKLHYLQIYCCHSSTTSSDCIPTSSTTASEIIPFAASYLTNTFGFNPESALRASKYLGFETAEHPESVINLLRTTYGFSQADIFELVKLHPLIFGCRVGTIRPKIEFLISKGASSPRDVLDVVARHPRILHRSLEDVIIPVYNLVKDLGCSDEEFIAALKKGSKIFFSRATDSDVSVSINFLRGSGVPESNIAYALIRWPEKLGGSGRVKEVVEELKEMGFDPSSKIFVRALIVRRGYNEPTWRKKIDVYMSWGFKEEEVFGMFKRDPLCMARSEKKISAVVDFFVNKLGWGISVITKDPPFLGRSLEKRFIPRDSVIQSLLSRGLIEKNSYCPKVFKHRDEVFLDRYVNCYECADELLKLYEKGRDEP